MGLFDFGKPEKKKVVSKEKAKEEFEIGTNGLIFNAKFQILTKDKKYAKEVSQKYFENIENGRDQKGNRLYFILKKRIEEPKKLRKSELVGLPKDAGANVFISTLDIDIGIKKKTNIFDFCFNYMPFFVEVMEPMNIVFAANELTNYISSIQTTLHKIDAKLKDAELKVGNLSNSMRRLLRNNILLSLKEKTKDLAEVSKNVGVSEDQLKPFIENMIKDKEIKLEKNKYQIIK